MTDKDSVAFEVTVTLEDVAAFVRYMSQSQARLARSYRLLGMYFGGLVGIATVTGPRWLILVCLGALPVILLTTRSCRRLRYELYQPLLSAKWVADPTGVTVRRPGATESYDWSAIGEIAPTDSHIFLRITPASGFVIPRRSLDGSADEERLLAFAAAARRADAAPTEP